ncbi:MAG: hypothetical protein L0Z53_26950 [Acidobacteriales bacterium]|nr:hypothetical protein [Terriglobales bacterium]
MRRIKLIETSVTNSAVPADFRLSYKTEFLRLCEISAEGMTISQMGDAIAVAKKIRDAEIGDTVSLENAEWEFLKSKLQSNRWTLISPEVVEMVKAVEAAESFDFTDAA